MDKVVELFVIAVMIVGFSSHCVWARSLKNGEVYQTENGSVKIEVVSSNQLEVDDGKDIVLAEYSMKGERLRVVYNILGTTIVEYFTFVDEGLKNREGTLYYSKNALDNLRDKQEKWIAEANKLFIGKTWTAYQDIGCDGRPDKTYEIVFHRNNLALTKFGGILQGNQWRWEAIINEEKKVITMERKSLHKFSVNATMVDSSGTKLKGKYREGLSRPECWSATRQHSLDSDELSRTAVKKTIKPVNGPPWHFCLARKRIVCADANILRWDKNVVHFVVTMGDKRIIFDSTAVNANGAAGYWKYDGHTQPSGSWNLGRTLVHNQYKGRFITGADGEYRATLETVE